MVRAVALGLVYWGLAVFSASAEAVRDLSVPMRSVSGYDQLRLVGRWYEVTRSLSRLQPDCHAVAADVETRDDSRLTLKIDCHLGEVTGPLLEIDGILVEIASGAFGFRLVRLREFGNLTLVVLWQADDDSLVVIGEPEGKVGWVWSKTTEIDPVKLEFGREKLTEAGYAPRLIVPVEQGNERHR